MTMLTDGAVRYRLQSWFSPAYPVGGYTYSHGLERAVEVRDVVDAGSAEAWIRDVLVSGAGRSDAILMAEAWRCEDADAFAELAELARALAPPPRP